MQIVKDVILPKIPEERGLRAKKLAREAKDSAQRNISLDLRNDQLGHSLDIDGDQLGLLQTVANDQLGHSLDVTDDVEIPVKVENEAITRRSTARCM